MLIQKIHLNMVPGGVPVVVDVSQYDDRLRRLQFTLGEGSSPFEIDSAALVSIRGTKPDNTGFEYPCTIEGTNVVSVDVQEQMTVLDGLIPCEIRVCRNDKIIGSANFILRVEKAAMGSDIEISETDLPLIEQGIQALAEVRQAASDAETAATNASASATNAAASETNAATSASTATTAAQNAQTAQGLAEDAKDDALAAKTAAETAAGQANTAATNAATSEANAATSATNAAASAQESAQYAHDYIPSGGTTGQVLKKASDTNYDLEWGEATAGGLKVLVSYADSTYSADHTFAEISANIDAGGDPYVVYNNTVYTLYSCTASAITFARPMQGGSMYHINITSENAITRTISKAIKKMRMGLSSLSWNGKVQSVIINGFDPDTTDISFAPENVSTVEEAEAQIAAFNSYDLHMFNIHKGGFSFYARGTVPTENVFFILTMRTM